MCGGDRSISACRPTRLSNVFRAGSVVSAQLSLGVTPATPPLYKLPSSLCEITIVSIATGSELMCRGCDFSRNRWR